MSERGTTIALQSKPLLTDGSMERSLPMTYAMVWRGCGRCDASRQYLHTSVSQ